MEVRDLVRRIATLRHIAGLSQREMARRLGTSQASYARVESGETALTVEFLIAFANALGIGFLDMFEAAPDRLSDEERLAVSALRTLPKNSREALLEVIRALAAHQGEDHGRTIIPLPTASPSPVPFTNAMQEHVESIEARAKAEMQRMMDEEANAQQIPLPNDNSTSEAGAERRRAKPVSRRIIPGVTKHQK